MFLLLCISGLLFLCVVSKVGCSIDQPTLATTTSGQWILNPLSYLAWPLLLTCQLTFPAGNGLSNRRRMNAFDPAKVFGPGTTKEKMKTEAMLKRKHRSSLKNKPGEPIVNRGKGAAFYCVACGQTYQKCKCRVYVSADTLKREKRYTRARQTGNVA
jgi:hypothetical protein